MWNMCLKQSVLDFRFPGHACCISSWYWLPFSGFFLGSENLRLNLIKELWLRARRIGDCVRLAFYSRLFRAFIAPILLPFLHGHYCIQWLAFLPFLTRIFISFSIFSRFPFSSIYQIALFIILCNLMSKEGTPLLRKSSKHGLSQFFPYYCIQQPLSCCSARHFYW